VQVGQYVTISGCEYFTCISRADTISVCPFCCDPPSSMQSDMDWSSGDLVMSGLDNAAAVKDDMGYGKVS